MNRTPKPTGQPRPTPLIAPRTTDCPCPFHNGYRAGEAAEREHLARAHVLLTKWSDWAALTWKPTDRTANSLLDATKRLLAELERVDD